MDKKSFDMYICPSLYIENKRRNGCEYVCMLMHKFHFCKLDTFYREFHCPHRPGSYIHSKAHIYIFMYVFHINKEYV